MLRTLGLNGLENDVAFPAESLLGINDMLCTFLLRSNELGYVKLFDLAQREACLKEVLRAVQLVDTVDLANCWWGSTLISAQIVDDDSVVNLDFEMIFETLQCLRVKNILPALLEEIDRVA